MPMKKLERNNTYDCLWPYILRILGDKPAHAYILRKEVEKRFGFRPGKVTAYLVLYSLERKGYVETRKEGRRKVYTMTGKGKRLLGKAIDFYGERIKLLE